MTATVPAHSATRAAARENPAIRTIVTPEGLSLPLTLAGRGARLGALALDIMILGLVAIAAIVALAYLAGNLTRFDGGKARQSGYLDAVQFLEVLFLIGGFLLHNGWFLFFELGPRGATPGKRMMGIRVAARGGGTLTPEMVIARNLLRDIEVFLPLAFIAAAAAGLSGGMAEGGAGKLAAAGWFALFAFFPFFNRDRLRAGDLIAGTWVVETHKQKLLPVMSLTGTPAVARAGSAAYDDRLGPHLYRFGDAELAIYGEFELQTLERVLRDSRADTLEAVAAAICAKIGWTAPGAAETRPFLQAFYTQLRARLESGMRFGKRKPDKFAQ
jgi:uncharacterized RDD family membrane protein YckC